MFPDCGADATTTEVTVGGGPVSSLRMVNVTSSGSGMAAFDTAPETLTTSFGSRSSSSTIRIVTVPVLSVAFRAKLSTRFVLSSKSSTVAGATGLAETVTV